MASILAAATGARELILGESNPTIDNWTFRLFYQYSTSLFAAASVLVTSNQFFGSPIECDLPQGGVSEQTLKSYCWMYSKFNLPENFGGHCGRKALPSDDQEMYNRYYQWVPLCLFGQAFLFYLPRALWLSLEGGLMKHLAKDKQGKVIEAMEEKCDSLMANYTEHLYGKYNRYYFAFLLCEILNLFIVFCQVVITDKFLQNSFLTYGSDVFRYYNIPEEERDMLGNYNPMCQAFPRVASCTYFRYGMAGRQESLQALCILALNIIIDKVYLILWIWYVILVIAALFRIFQRLLQTVSQYRYILLKLRMHRYFRDKEQCANIRGYVNSCSIGDWFVLYQMSKNMNRRLFYLFLNKLSKVEKDGIKKPLLKDDTTETVIAGLEEPDSANKKKKDEKEDKGDKDKKDEDKKKEEKESPERRTKKEKEEEEDEFKWIPRKISHNLKETAEEQTKQRKGRNMLMSSPAKKSGDRK